MVKIGENKLTYSQDFWNAIDNLVSTENIVIDRPKGSTHPRFPGVKYDVDYGYIENTTAMDGGGIDVWRGSLPAVHVDAIMCTVDLIHLLSGIPVIWRRKL